MTENQPESVRTQDGAVLNATQQRLADSATRQGYTWWLQEDSLSHIVVGHDIEHPYSERHLLIYNADRATSVYLASPAGMTRITHREAFTLLTHQTL